MTNDNHTEPITSITDTGTKKRHKKKRKRKGVSNNTTSTVVTKIPDIRQSEPDRTRKDVNRQRQHPLRTGLLEEHPMENIELRWLKVGNYWECPKCEIGVKEITGTRDGEYIKFTFCPGCGHRLY